MIIKKFFEFYSQEAPMTRQGDSLSQDDMLGNDHYENENKFQQVQEYMKILLKPIILKKNKNADNTDIEKVSDSFFNLGGNKSQEVKRMVDACKDTKQCANDIINKYFKYVKINFGLKDEINDMDRL